MRTDYLLHAVLPSSPVEQACPSSFSPSVTQQLSSPPLCHPIDIQFHLVSCFFFFFSFSSTTHVHGIAHTLHLWVVVGVGVAGVLGASAVFPLDMAKTRLQNQTVRAKCTSPTPGRASIAIGLRCLSRAEQCPRNFTCTIYIFI